jgi:hypothetical protein
MGTIYWISPIFTKFSMKHASRELQFVKIQAEPMAFYEHVYVTTSGHAPCARGQLRAIRHRKPIHRWLARVSGLRLNEYDSIVETMLGRLRAVSHFVILTTWPKQYLFGSMKRPNAPYRRSRRLG